MSNYFLEHYGVVGMRWGKRKAGSQLLIEGTSISGGSNSSGYNSSNFRSSQEKQRAKNANYRPSDSSSSKSSSSSKRKQDSNSEKTSKTKEKKGYKDNPSDIKTDPIKKSEKFDAKSTQSGIKDGKKLIDGGAKYLDNERKKRSIKQIKDEAKTMTDDDLREVINRMSMEDKYASLMEKRGYTEAKSDLQKTLEVVGEIAGYADTALSIYDKIQDIRGR